jgi:hypothetical protein
MPTADDEALSFAPGGRSKGYRSRTAILFAVAEITGKLACFLVFAVATRMLGPDGFGQFSWAMGLGMMAAPFRDVRVRHSADPTRRRAAGQDI